MYYHGYSQIQINKMNLFLNYFLWNITHTIF